MNIMTRHLHLITEDIAGFAAVLAQAFLRLCLCALRTPFRRALRVPNTVYPILIYQIPFPLPWRVRSTFGVAALGAWGPDVKRNLGGRLLMFRKVIQRRPKARLGRRHLRKR